MPAARARRAACSSSATRRAASGAISASRGFRPGSASCSRRRSSLVFSWSLWPSEFLRFAGGRPDLAQALPDRERFGVELDLDQRRLACGHCPLESGGELLGAQHRLAMGAIGAGEGGEVGIVELRAQDTLGIVALLVRADGAVHAVVHDDEDDGET